ncbi:MAG TPA: hypothetical protein VFI48_01650 [Hyphomicrobiaceae bacterium]|nr:hypothetical protein [Hyphomicrobiaceae bacterium]
MPRAIAELCRVSRLRVIATVRALAGPPTGCIIGLEQLRDDREDCSRGLLTLVLKDGSAHRLTFNLFPAKTLKTLFATRAGVVDLRAVDLFLSRFAPDAKWNSTLVNALPGREDVMGKLKEIEEQLCRQPGWVDHGTHILIVAEPKPACRQATWATKAVARSLPGGIGRQIKRNADWRARGCNGKAGISAAVYLPAR